MTPSTAEKLLTFLLRINGLMLSTAVVTIFFPVSVMAWIHELLEMGELPTAPIAVYLARSCSLLYATHGPCFLTP